MIATRVALLVALAMAAGSLAARALATYAPVSTAAGFAQPIAVATDWHAFGALLLAALAVATALAGWAYLRVLSLLRAGAADDLSIGLVACVSAAAIACAWFAPAIFSSDVYAYAAYGEMARTGIAAYSHAVLPSGDPIFAAAIWQWGNPPPACVYGPAFVAIAGATLSALAPFGTLVQLDGLRALAGVALVLSAIAAYAAYPGQRRERLAAAATIGLNPVAIWCAAEGHNDALALAVVLCGYALLRRAPATGAALAALAGSIKAPGLIAALPLVFSSQRARFGAIAGIVVSLVVSYPLVRALVTQTAPGGHYAPQASLQAAFGAYPILAAVVAVAACAFLVRKAMPHLRGREPEGWVYLALALWVLVPNPYPWYGLWLVAAAALAPGTRVAAVALLLSLTSLLRYAPDAIAAPNEPAAIALGMLAIVPFALLR
ncbi:MAG TPA: hypothetical protein VK760_00845 [Candidatus Acidoferrales bacterium]|jgi:hypothetical protein|nr:hypothetical protein [Candidatus Acidoferrales bacterium]